VSGPSQAAPGLETLKALLALLLPLPVGRRATRFAGPAVLRKRKSRRPFVWSVGLFLVAQAFLVQDFPNGFFWKAFWKAHDGGFGESSNGFGKLAGKLWRFWKAYGKALKRRFARFEAIGFVFV
jgi:hypothetical protein